MPVSHPEAQGNWALLVSLKHSVLFHYSISAVDWKLPHVGICTYFLDSSLLMFLLYLGALSSPIVDAAEGRLHYDCCQERAGTHRHMDIFVCMLII